MLPSRRLLTLPLLVGSPMTRADGAREEAELRAGPLQVITHLLDAAPEAEREAQGLVFLLDHSATPSAASVARPVVGTRHGLAELPLGRLETPAAAGEPVRS